MLVIYLCLSGVRRIVWGDLGKGIDSESLTKTTTDTACQQHEEYLIVELVRRTNRLRVAILFTGYEFGLLCVISVQQAVVTILNQIYEVDFHITKATQTITFTGFTVTAGASSGGTVTYSTTTPGVCSVSSGGAVSIIGSGTCNVIASQAGDSNYLPVTRNSNPIVQ